MLAWLKMDFLGNQFFDTCAWLTKSLDDLCDAYKINDSKKTEFKFKVGGQEVELTNLQMCLCKPELDWHEFMEFLEENKEFREAYIDYCETDCKPLLKVWYKFENCIFK